MGEFKKIFNENIMFSKKGERKYNMILNLESTDDSIIITYVEDKIKKKIKLSESNINNYNFIQRTKNLFYKKYNKISVNDIISEMDTGDAGIGGTATTAGVYEIDHAEGDNRMPYGGFPVTRRPKITDTFLGKKKKKKKKKGKKNKKS